MTGCHVPITRNGEHINVEIEHLTEEERADFFMDKGNTTLLRWIDTLCERIKAEERFQHADTQDAINPLGTLEPLGR